MKNRIKKISSLVSIFLIILSCSKDDSSSDTTDPNSDFPTIIIGTQEWMQVNLDVTTYRNGDEIPQVTDPNEWFYLTSGAWCYYENNSENGTTYGKLYNWYAVNDPRGIAPIGWHVPNDDEWTTLTTYLGGEEVAGGKMKETGDTHWLSPNTAADNSSGFTGLPGASRTFLSDFDFIGNNGYWWSSTQMGNSNSVYYRVLNYNNGSINRYANTKSEGFSIRCLRD